MRLLIAEDEKDLNQVITKTLQKTIIPWIPAWTGRKRWIVWIWPNMMP